MADNIAVNANGEAVQWDGTEWKPVPTAQHPETKERQVYIGGEWLPIGGKPPEPPPGDPVGRGVRAFGTGANDAVGGTIGAVPDLVTAGLNAGVNVGRRALGYSDAQPFGKPGQYADFAKKALNSVGDYFAGGHLNPATPVERGLYAAGEGAGNAAMFAAGAGGVRALAGAGARALPSVALGTESAAATPATAGQGLVAQSVRPGTMVGKLSDTLATAPVTQAVAGGVGGAVEQGTDSRLAGFGASMLVPFGNGILRGVVSPGLSQLNPEQARLSRMLGEEGVQLTPGQQSGSVPMKTLEGVFKTLPLTSGPETTRAVAQKVQYNRAVLRRAGIDADYATPDVVEGGLDRAWERMSNVYQRNNLQLDVPTMQNVENVMNTARSDLGANTPAFARVQAKYDDFISRVQAPALNNIHVPGSAYAAFDSDLSRMAREGSDTSVNAAILRLRNALREGFAGNVADQADAAELAEARRHYANGRVIKHAMNTPTQDAVAGNVAPSKLASALAGGDKDHFAAGRGDLNDLARGGVAFVKDSIPNSGTPQRNFWQNLLTGGVTGAGVGGVSGFDPVHMAMWGAVPSVVQGLAHSRLGQAYLTNQFARHIAPQATPGTATAIAAPQLPGLMMGDAPRKPGYTLDVYPEGDPRNRQQ